MRLGGPVYVSFDKDPEGWANAHRLAGYRAAYVPLKPDADDATIARFQQVCADYDLVIAEVGAWSNPISPDAEIRTAAREKCVRALELAERVGARCCVNIAGAMGEQWDGPHPDNLTDATFDRIVASVRDIIDAVGPTTTFYTLEPMPWIYPDSPDSYLRLIEAVDRERFAVHLDPVNMINSPERCFKNADFLRECFARLGPRTVSIHAKDINLSGKLTVHLDEARPGLGVLDYETFLTEADKLDADVPFLLEHLPAAEDYAEAAAYVRAVAARIGVTL
jgi:sugar phosphate isomerase/epimerase